MRVKAWMVPSDYDIVIAGGGLAGSLAALAVAEAHPDLRLLLIDEAEHLGGNHVWSFFDSDVDPLDRPLLASMIAAAWPGYEVRFPAYRRTYDVGYQSITSERLDSWVRQRLGASAIRTDTGISELGPTHVRSTSGDCWTARAVIDARGAGDVSTLSLGWQKFVGQILRLERPHDVSRPVVMDATVRQLDGYRFAYTLPFAVDRLFVEDTYYSDTPELDTYTIRLRIADYAAARGWRIAGVEREEAGVLPVVMGGDFSAYWRSTGEGIAKVGIRAGLFHPTTGYSLPDAVRTARVVARNAHLPGEALARVLRTHAAKTWRQRRFYRLLDRMLFRAAEPDQRYRVLERFYGLSPSLVGRFYAGRSTLKDKLRMVTGRPPVPLIRGIRAALA